MHVFTFCEQQMWWVGSRARSSGKWKIEDTHPGIKLGAVEREKHLEEIFRQRKSSGEIGTGAGPSASSDGAESAVETNTYGAQLSLWTRAQGVFRSMLSVFPKKSPNGDTKQTQQTRSKRRNRSQTPVALVAMKKKAAKTEAATRSRAMKNESKPRKKSGAPMKKAAAK